MLVAKHNAGWVIILSFIVALLLTAMPLPEWLVNWWPAWLVMVLVYWCMALPQRVGIGIAWALGFLLDVQTGALLGQNALGLSVIAYFTSQTHRQIRVFPLIQQSLLICFYLILFQFYTLWIRGMTGVPPQHWSFWAPAVTSMLLWPWLFIIMRGIRHKYRVS